MVDAHTAHACKSRSRRRYSDMPTHRPLSLVLVRIIVMYLSGESIVMLIGIFGGDMPGE